MNDNNNKMIVVLITAITMAAILVAGPSIIVNPVFALGHYSEGDNDVASHDYDRFEDCLTDHEFESSEVTEEQIEHCIDLAYHGESDELSREDTDDDSDEDEARQSEDDEDDKNELEDSAFFGDDSEDSISNNFYEKDSAGDEGSTTDY